MAFRYTDVFIDIINVCNAKCPYCLTGSRNRSGNNAGIKASPMSASRFAEIMDHLMCNDIITPEAWVGLYNWYEPFLNPQLGEIIRAAGDRGLQIGLSTNASVVPDLRKAGDCSHVNEIIFSMCGFSQKSYDRIHGFSFDKIRENMALIITSFREHGFDQVAYIHYHVYQFNIGEVYAAKEFADSINLPIKFTYAYFNNDEFRPYLEGTMSKERLKEVSKDLFFCYLDDIFENVDYYDEEFREDASMTISENGNLIKDRNVNDDAAICSVFDCHSPDEVRSALKSSYTPDETDRKICVWGHTYNMTINHLFGFDCDLPGTLKPLSDQKK